MKRNISRRFFLRTSLGGMASGVALWSYTRRIEPFWLEFIERPLPIQNLPDNLVGLRLIQLSDLHIGCTDDKYLVNVFEKVKNLAPDLVVYTGDFTSYHRKIFKHAQRMFSHLPHGKKGTLGILGNHDYGPGWSHPEIAEKISSIANDSGVHMLRNEIMDIDGMQIVGFDDLWAHHFKPKKAFSNLKKQKASLALSHNPDAADEAGWENYSGWILSGHTHGGQCKPPFLPPPLLPVKNKRYTSGEFTLSGERKMYISRGAGYILRARFNVRPEVTIFNLMKT